jgi:hypothetical protein
VLSKYFYDIHFHSFTFEHYDRRRFARQPRT